MKSKKTDKQRLFILEYVACLDATVAARRAGYSGDANTLAEIGFQNLRKPAIQAEIDRLLKERVMPKLEVLARLSDQARSDVSDFLRIDPDSGQVSIDLTKVSDKLHLIKKIRYGKDGKLQSIELHDAQAALVHLGRFYALFTENLNVIDWRSKAIEDIRQGKIDYDVLAEAFDSDLATELFRSAGVPIGRNSTNSTL